MSAAVPAAYLVGAVLGLIAHRFSGLGRVWPLLVRLQIVVAAIALSVVAAWRLSGVSGLLWPVMMVSVFGVLLAVSYAVTGQPRRAGISALRAWTAYSNTSYFGIPMAGVLGGPSGVLVAVLVDRLGLPVWSLSVWMMRRDAPIPQRTTSSWIDQSPLIAFGAGLALKLVGTAPAWTVTVSVVFAPILAGTGAAIFVGSVLHRTQRIDPRPGLRSWLFLVVLRLVLFAPMIFFVRSPSVGVVVALTALSIPAFGPPQMSTVYGYSDAVVSAASRYGWVIGALGIITAVGIAH